MLGACLLLVLLAAFSMLPRAVIAPPNATSLYLLLDRQQRLEERNHRHDPPPPMHQVIRDTLVSLDRQIDGAVYFADDKHFAAASRVWVRGAKPPAAVIEVASERDVATTLRHAMAPLMRAFPGQIDFRVRSGGHSKAGYSTAPGGVVLSLARLDRIRRIDLDAATVALEPAVRVEQFVDTLVRAYNYTSVVGFCGSVAESGFVLGGGFGAASRLYGLGMDNIRSMRVVLADGTILEHVAGSDDLFWALRGAGGGSFGVVTEMQLAIHKTSPKLELFSIVLSATSMATFLHRMADLDIARRLPGNFAMLVDEFPGPSLFKANMLWTGRSDEEVHYGKHYVLDMLDDILSSAEPYTLTHGSTNWADWYRPDAVPQAWGQPVLAAGCWYGFLLPEHNSEAIWQEIMDIIAAGLRKSAPYLAPDIELWGGAIHDTAANATAFPYRSAVYNVGVLLTIPKGTHKGEKLFQQHSRLVDGWWPRVAAHLTGSYVNYPMTSLGKDYARVYWGDNLERLVAIKDMYDPDNMFRFPMSVPGHI